MTERIELGELKEYDDSTETFLVALAIYTFLLLVALIVESDLF